MFSVLVFKFTHENVTRDFKTKLCLFLSLMFAFFFLHPSSGHNRSQSGRQRSGRAEHDERVQANNTDGGPGRSVPGHYAELHQSITGRLDQLRRVRVYEPCPRRQHDVICFPRRSYTPAAAAAAPGGRTLFASWHPRLPAPSYHGGNVILLRTQLLLPSTIQPACLPCGCPRK